MTERMPEPIMKRAPCSQCGARTEKQAESVCSATQGIDGDYHCAGEFKGGWSVQETPESIAALNAWCDREAVRNGWK